MKRGKVVGMKRAERKIVVGSFRVERNFPALREDFPCGTKIDIQT